jgi:5-methylcytosine-specific restriction endonuclease McrA
MGKDKPKPYKCHYCKKEFMAVGKREKTVYCTHDCYLDDRYGKDRPHTGKYIKQMVCKIKIIICLDCNVLLVARSANRLRCTHCAYLKQIERSNQREHEIRIPHRQAGDKITRKELHAKDGGRCYICHRLTVLHNKGKKRNKRLATIDHVIPVAHGGSHTWANVRNCCWECNIRKGSKELNDYQEIMVMEYE